MSCKSTKSILRIYLESFCASVCIDPLCLCLPRQKSPSLTPEDTLRNLENICQALRKTGNQEKSIYLCSLPTAGDDTVISEEQQADNLTRNRLIQEYIAA